MNFLVVFLLAIGVCLNVPASDTLAMAPGRALESALEDGGLPNLLRVLQRHRWQALRMPSKWSVEHRDHSEEQGNVDLASREFGRKLAVQLDAIALVLQELPPDDELFQQANLLCDLSDWCASTPGYGNLFLAQRCLDLAAVGLARLAASLDFPLDKCKGLAGRMSPAWMSVGMRARTLNDEAGAKLFEVDGTQSELEQTWRSGRFLMKEKLSGTSRPKGRTPGYGIVETPTLKANIDFFEDDSLYVRPWTLVLRWDKKWHVRIVNGLELQNVDMAMALVKFHEVIGSFPDKIEFNEDQLREHEAAVKEAARLGLEVSRLDEGQPAGRAAFQLAWDQRKDRDPKDNNLDAKAWQAYSEVMSGQFLDMDTREMRLSSQMSSEPKSTAK